jgi:four helix bundle protein
LLPGTVFYQIEVWEMKCHRDLEAWKKSMSLVQEIYRITSSFPNQEIYGLTNQMRRAGVSIPSNIAEGAARNSKKEFIQFLHIALGSLSEVETQILIAKGLGYINEQENLLKEIETIRKLVAGLIRSLKKTVTNYSDE